VSSIPDDIISFLVEFELFNNTAERGSETATNGSELDMRLVRQIVGLGK